MGWRRSISAQLWQGGLNSCYRRTNFKAAWYTGNELELVLFSKVGLYDPKTSTWKYQNTTGTIPEPRLRPCSVAAKGDNDTYEVSLLSGTDHG